MYHVEYMAFLMSQTGVWLRDSTFTRYEASFIPYLYE
jgi:hypothetical protein